MEKIVKKNKKQNIQKKYRNKILIVLILVIILIVSFLIISTFSRYRSKTSSETTLDVAFYVTKAAYQIKDIKLSDIEPSDNSYEYTFSIANTDGVNRAETNLEYDVTLKITTNLPLEYGLQMNGQDAIESDEIKKDDDGTYFRYIKTATQKFGYEKDEQNNYKIIIRFPKTYNDIKYQDIIEAIEIEVESRQTI